MQRRDNQFFRILTGLRMDYKCFRLERVRNMPWLQILQQLFKKVNPAIGSKMAPFIEHEVMEC